MSTVDIFPSAERINAHIFASESNERLFQAKAILSLSAKSPLLIRAAADVIGAVSASVIFADNLAIGDDAISTISNRLVKAREILCALSEEEDVGDDTVELICRAAVDFLAQAMESIGALCS